jgi:hypothetical protein
LKVILDKEFLIDLLEPVELIMLANEHSGLGATYFALYLSLVSGYLVVAYLAGEKLTQSQVATVNSIFVLSAVFFTLSTMGNFVFAIAYYTRAPFRDSVLLTFYGMALFDLLVALAMIGGIFACLKFMRDIRRPK